MKDKTWDSTQNSEITPQRQRQVDEMLGDHKLFLLLLV